MSGAVVGGVVWPAGGPYRPRGSSALAADLIKRRLSMRVPEAGGAAGGGLMGEVPTTPADRDVTCCRGRRDLTARCAHGFRKTIAFHWFLDG